eukprot:scaffold43875_cov34-Tisochrysis_lutea.AAC.1
MLCDPAIVSSPECPLLCAHVHVKSAPSATMLESRTAPHALSMTECYEGIYVNLRDCHNGTLRQSVRHLRTHQRSVRSRRHPRRGSRPVV